MTTPYVPRRGAAPDPFKMEGLSRTDIQRELDRIASMEVYPGMKTHVSVTVVLDRSGSMKAYDATSKNALLQLNRLKFVSNRQYTLHIIIINNDRPRSVFFGDIRQLDLASFNMNLPQPGGNTPYAEAIKMAMDLESELMELFEEKKHWYNPCEVFLTITDCLANDKSGTFAAEITKRLAEKAQNGTAVLTEFVTQNNKKGLATGGYKVYIDQKTSERQVAEYAKALVFATSTNVIEGSPDKRKRLEYNHFLGDRLLCELNAAFERSINPMMGGV